MMKYYFLIILFVLSFKTYAQHDSSKTSDAEKLIERLKVTWKLGVQKNELLRPNDEKLVEFKDLFMEEANIEPDLDRYYDTSKVYVQSMDIKGLNGIQVVTSDSDYNLVSDNTKYKISKESFDSLKNFSMYNLLSKTLEYDAYANYLINHFSSISLDFDTTIINPGDSVFSLARTMHGEKKGKYIFSLFDESISSEISSDSAYNDGLNKILISSFKFSLIDTIDVTVINLDGTYKIKHIKHSIKYPGTSFICANDKDRDAFTDDVEECDSEFGPIRNSGCPVINLIFPSSFELGIFVGYQVTSTKIDEPSLENIGYNETDILQSKNGTISNSRPKSSFNAGTDLTYYFGKPDTSAAHLSDKIRRCGITSGLWYSKSKAEYEVTESLVYTFRSNDGTDDYRRRITIREGSNEEITINRFNIPLLFTYRWIISKNKMKTENKTYDVYGGGYYKWSFRLSVGPNFIFSKGVSYYDMNIDFEGLYQIDSVDPKIYYDPYFDNTSTWNVYVTADSINSVNTNPGAVVVFNALNGLGYDFATNRNYKGKSNPIKSFSIGINLRFEASYNISDDLSLNFGTSFVYAIPSKPKSGYIPIDKTTDEFNSLYNADSKTNYIANSINVGFVFRFGGESKNKYIFGGSYSGKGKRLSLN